MFDSVGSRYVLRAFVAATLAGLGAAGTALADGAVQPVEWIGIASAVFGAFGVYLGVGAASPPVEPNIGNKMEE